MKSIRLDNSTYVHVYVHRIPVSLEEKLIQMKNRFEVQLWKENVNMTTENFGKLITGGG